MEGIAWGNTLGFGIVKTRLIRLWMGPQLNFSYLKGNPEGADDFRIQLWSVGISPVIGINFNFGKAVTLSIDSGYRFSTYWGDGEGEGYYDTDYEVDAERAFINFSILYRFGDR
jgi:hypothetical protein